MAMRFIYLMQATGSHPFIDGNRVVKSTIGYETEELAHLLAPAMHRKCLEQGMLLEPITIQITPLEVIDCVS